MNAATMAKWLERRGALTSVRLTDSPKARSYNIIAEVEALARGGRDASATAVAPNSAKPA